MEELASEIPTAESITTKRRRLNTSSESFYYLQNDLDTEHLPPFSTLAAIADRFFENERLNEGRLFNLCYSNN
jgi:hypothetical protein